MPKQNGLIKIEGTLDDVTFYKRGGKHFARSKGGISAERIQSDPRLARMRQNMNEFKGSAAMAKAIRSALSRDLKLFRDAQFNSELMRKVRSLAEIGVGDLGYRNFDLSLDKALLRRMQLNSRSDLESVLKVDYTLATVTDRNEATATFPDFDPRQMLEVPDGATHFRLILAIGSVSDYHYDPLRKVYLPVDEAVNNLHAIARSAELNVKTPVGAITTIIAQLAGAPVLPASTSLIVGVGIEFLRLVNGVYHLQFEMQNMRIDGVF